MEALLQYGSDGESSSSDEQQVLSDHPPPKRSRKSDAAPAATPQRPSLLPSAAALLDGSYSPPPAAQQRAVERADLHQGRSRAFPHAAGNFPTHIYIQVETPPACLAALEALLQLLRARLPGLQAVSHGATTASSSSQGPAAAAPTAAAVSTAAAVGSSGAPARGTERMSPPVGCRQMLAQSGYHVSLSRTVPLLLHQIEPLVESLRRRLRQQDTFCIRVGQPEVLANDEATRTFLCLAAGDGGSGSSDRAGGPGSTAGPTAQPLQAGTEQQLPQGSPADPPQRESPGRQTEAQAEGHQQQGLTQGRASGAARHYSAHLVALCHAVSSVFAAHGLPRFYEEPRPHASVAWLLGDGRQILEAALAEPEVQHAAEQLAAQAWHLSPAAIVCKAGQREHVVWHAPKGGADGAAHTVARRLAQ